MELSALGQSLNRGGGSVMDLGPVCLAGRRAPWMTYPSAYLLKAARSRRALLAPLYIDPLPASLYWHRSILL
jgi:hypothetical protein